MPFQIMLNLCDSSMRTRISTGFIVEQLRLLLLKSLGSHDLAEAPNGFTTVTFTLGQQPCLRVFRIYLYLTYLYVDRRNICIYSCYLYRYICMYSNGLKRSVV